jgi:hypothetical protein
MLRSAETGIEAAWKSVAPALSLQESPEVALAADSLVRALSDWRQAQSLEEAGPEWVDWRKRSAERAAAALLEQKARWEAALREFLAELS